MKPINKLWQHKKYLWKLSLQIQSILRKEEKKGERKGGRFENIYLLLIIFIFLFVLSFIY